MRRACNGQVVVHLCTHILRGSPKAALKIRIMNCELKTLHIGIIMDGNGRWAASRGKVRTEGHLEGLKTARRIVEAASNLGVTHLTLYVFSTENWKRAQDEVDYIMGLVKKHLLGEIDFYRENGIRIRHTGDASGLPPDIAKEVLAAARDTKDFPGMQVILAINYGGRDEIVRAVNKAGTAVITEQLISANRDNPDVPDADLIIRTGGESRTSNFLLWESAYSELYFSDKLWPDWTAADLEAAIADFKKRSRRFGAVLA